MYDRLPFFVLDEAPLNHALRRALVQYEQGHRHLSARRSVNALAAASHVLHGVGGMDDARCNILLLYALTMACEAKLQLGYFESCSTLCTYLVGKTVAVPLLQDVQQHLLSILREAKAAEAQVCETPSLV